MNKKGFTLVELLAVIVIMAIIILIAIPNVMEGLNEAKTTNFGNEVVTLKNSAKNQFNMDKGRGKVKYTTYQGERYAVYCSGIDVEAHPECDGAYEVSNKNSNGMNYKIMVRIDGYVAYAYVTDGRFVYACVNDDECVDFSEDFVVDTTKSGKSIDEYEIKEGPEYISE